MARPSSYNDEVADAICERLIGGESLRTICASEDMPGVSTVCRWLAQHERFREQYARAREMQADTLTDEMLNIADDGTNDWMERRNADGDIVGWTVNGEAVQRSKLRIDARKWYASKLAPKKYGDQLALTGAGGGPVQIQRIERAIVDPPTQP